MYLKASNLLLFLVSLLLLQCEPIDGDLGQDLNAQTINARFNRQSIPVESSTLLLETVPTTRTNRILIGNYTLPEIGSIHAESFISFGIDEDETILNNPANNFEDITIQSAPTDLSTLLECRCGDLSQIQSLWPRWATGATNLYGGHGRNW